ncbi:hypothetical protein [Geomonas propionica]|uniref:Uncharacterized protein n=1 Tax=Geomonas propionica TaxID=2798582 RepID=A0ABS0YVR1_9BACT|nr:hypothetical protein [Geomonas propionica]MBJ6802066.1 hypothetical protein [Geomonas propionica]
MKNVVTPIVITWILTKITAIDKGWLWFCCACGVSGGCGYDVGMVGFLVAAGVFKVLKDIFGKGRK